MTYLPCALIIVECKVGARVALTIMTTAMALEVKGATARTFQPRVLFLTVTDEILANKQYLILVFI